MKTKTFDCVAMKHRAQQRIRRELANLTKEEELAYWREIVEQDRLRREAIRRSAGEETTAECEQR
jgi:hypothetical protein